MNLTVQTINSWTAFEGLANEWNSLLGRSGSNSIFLTWEWIRSWREAIEEAVDPYVIVVRDENNALVGIAPLYVASIKLLRMISFRALRYMADTATGAEYPDWIVDANNEDEICDAISAHLRDKRKDWDVVWLSTVAGWTGASKRLRGGAERNDLVVRSRNREFTHIELPADILEFENQFSAKSRQRIRRNCRRVLGTEGVEVVRCTSSKDLQTRLTELFDLHQLRWRATGIDGGFLRKPVVEDFYRKMAPVALEKDWLRFFILKQDDVVKAAQIGYVFNGSYLQLQEGYDPDFQPGTGNALRHQVIKQCLESGIRHFDFLAGTSEHKRRWGGDIRNGFDVLIANKSLRSRLFFLTGMWPTGRFMQEVGLVTGAGAH